MFARSALKITESLIKNQIISEADFEIYNFGIKAGFAILANIAITLTIGVLLKMPLESLLMLAVFIPLRSCAGGIHASNNIRCLILSAISVFLVLMTARMTQDLFNEMLLLIIGIACSVTIFVLAPVQDANRPIDKDEARSFKRRTLKVLCVAIILFLALLYVGLKIAAVVFTITLFLICLSVCVGALKNHILRNRRL